MRRFVAVHEDGLRLFGAIVRDDVGAPKQLEPAAERQGPVAQPVFKTGQVV